MWYNKKSPRHITTPQIEKPRSNGTSRSESKFTRSRRDGETPQRILDWSNEPNPEYRSPPGQMIRFLKQKWELGRYKSCKRVFKQMQQVELVWTLTQTYQGLTDTFESTR